ncbi:Rap guanine nucleotide exchange factor 4 [Geodia barretti]|nr:Rap guanine nucleotide exchange factor 4 [Geodia barretti]
MDGAWHWVSCLGKRPSRRSETDLDIIMSRMKSMVVFERYPESALHELSRVVLYDTHLANTTLFRPGENGMYWYVVVSGTLEMFNVDSRHDKKTTLICQLQSGDSFGENVVLEATRETMVVTKTYCELLYVEADNIRRIYETHKDVMENLLHPRAAAVGTEEADGEEGGAFPQSELALAGATVHEIITSHYPNLLADHRVNMYTYKSCCSGSGLVDWVIAQSAIPRTRQQVAQMWQALLLETVLQHSHKVHPFLDDPQLFYKFCDLNSSSSSSSSSERSAPLVGGRLQQLMNLFSFSRNSTPSASPAPSPTPRRRPNSGEDAIVNGRPRSASSVGAESRSSRGSIHSVLEECFDTISRLSPEVLILATLAKEPCERTEEDKNMIYEELLNVRALRHLTNAVKREVAACVRLQHHPRPGQYLFHQGEKGDSWYVVLKGSVNVIIKGKGVVCTLHEGDDFGKLSLLTAGERSASIRTREPNSYFLQIESNDFRRILMSVEDSTLKITHRGREVMHLQRETVGSYTVIRGTPERMLDHLVGSEVDTSQEGSFAHDFFLTHVAFMSMADVCSGLLTRYREKKEEEKESEGEVVTTTRKKRIARAVAVWINVAKSQLVKDAVFLGLLKELQDGLEADGLTEELEVLNTSLSESIRSAILGKHTHSPVLSGSLNHILSKGRGRGGGLEEPRITLGICSVPPAQPQDMEGVRVHTEEHICCRLVVRLDTKAGAIRDEACSKLHLPKFKYQLCEVTSSGQKKVLKEDDISVMSETSVNGRLFILPRSHSQRTVSPLQDQNVKPVIPFPEDSAREIAAHLTLFDWNLFSNTQQMEVVYNVFGRHKFGKIVTNLDLLLRRFIEVKFWIVTTMCMEPDLTRRVALLKKFIKIAGYCKGHSNVNSFLAIVLALSNPAVSRMKLTWKELAPKMKRRFDSFDAITDPSRNQKVLRAYQSKLPRPVVPFMPLVMKDMAFLHEGNETMIEGLVNFEKMRLLAEKVRSLFEFRTGSLPNDVCLLANKNPELQKYIR